MAEENKTEETTSPAPEPATSPVDEAGNPENPSDRQQKTGMGIVQILGQLQNMLSESGDTDADLMKAINAMMSYGAQMSAGGRTRNPSFGPFMASFVRPAGPEKTGIAKASPERIAEKAEDRRERREANRNKQARSIVALALEKGKGINAAMGQLKDRFGDNFATTWGNNNGVRQDDNGQFRATEDVQDGIVRAAGRMTPEDKAARREGRLAKTQKSRLKRMDGADGTKPDGKISPEEEAADRAARDQRMKDRISSLEQVDATTGEKFKPDTDGDGVIDDAERAEQNRRIGNVEPTYTSPRDKQRNEAFEGVGLRAPRAGETSAMDVVRTDSQEELDRKIGQINEDFAGRDKEAAAVRQRADQFESQVPGVMEPSRVPGQSLDIEAAMSQKIEDIMPSILDGSMTSEEGARQLVQLREGVIEQTDPTQQDLERLQQDSMNFGPTPLSTEEQMEQRNQAFAGLRGESTLPAELQPGAVTDPMMGLQGGSALPDRATPSDQPIFDQPGTGRAPIAPSTDSLREMEDFQRSDDALKAMGDPPSMIGPEFDQSLVTYGTQQPDAIQENPLIPDQEPEMAGYQGGPRGGGRGVSPSNDFMQRFFGQGQFYQPEVSLNPALTQPPAFYDAMGNPIYGFMGTGRSY